MLNFLTNLGTGLGRAFAQGATTIGKGAVKGVKRLGELQEEPIAPDIMLRTPGFNPNAGGEGDNRSLMEIMAPSDRRLTGGMDPYVSQRGVRGLEDSVAAAESAARAEFGDAPDLPIRRGDLPIPKPPPGPAASPSFGGLTPPPVTLPNLRTPPSVAPGMSLAGPALAAGMEELRPEMDLDRRNVPIPRLPGESGGPTSYNPMGAAKYDFVMEGAKRDAEGDLAGGFNRDWKMSLRNALLGGAAAARGGDLGAALGGALTAGVGTAINPQAGREFAFDYGERPKLEAEMNRAQSEAERERRGRMALFDEALKTADLESKILGNQKTRSDIRIAEGPKYHNTPGGTLNASGTIIPGTAPPPRERPTSFKYDTDGLPYDLNDPKERGRFEALPRGKRVKPEKATGDGSGSGSSQKEMRAARVDMGQFERLKGEAIRAQQEGDESLYGAKRNEMDALAGRIEALYGDSVEVGAFGGWPYVKFRQGSSKPNNPSSGGSAATMEKLREFYKSRGVTDDAEIRRRAKANGVTVKEKD